MHYLFTWKFEYCRDGAFNSLNWKYLLYCFLCENQKTIPSFKINLSLFSLKLLKKPEKGDEKELDKREKLKKLDKENLSDERASGQSCTLPKRSEGEFKDEKPKRSVVEGSWVHLFSTCFWLLVLLLHSGLVRESRYWVLWGVWGWGGQVSSILVS